MPRFILLIVLAFVGPALADERLQGPMLGELDSDGVAIWFRPAERGPVPEDISSLREKMLTVEAEMLPAKAGFEAKRKVFQTAKRSHMWGHIH